MLPLVLALAAAPDFDALAVRTRALIERLVAADTSNPPGNEAPAAAIARERLAEAGIAAEVVEAAPGRANLIARLKGNGTKRGLLLVAHLDTVPAKRDEWATDPWKLTEVNGHLYGRGVIDDKGMAAALVEALAAFAASGAPRSRDVVLLLDADEEGGGGAGIDHLVEKRPELFRDVEIALNEGGEVRLREGKVAYLAVQSAEKMFHNLVLTAKGEGGHSSLPRGRNAAVAIADATARIGRMKLPPRLTAVTRAFFAGLAPSLKPPLSTVAARVAKAKEPATADLEALAAASIDWNAMLRTTCVPTVLSSGDRSNVIPATGTCTVNCRVLPGDDVQAIATAVRKAIGDPEIQVENRTPVYPSPETAVPNALFDAVRAVAAQRLPGVPVVPLLSPGATDNSTLRGLGIAAHGLLPFPLTAEDDATMHGARERMPTASVRFGVEILYRVVAEAAR